MIDLIDKKILRFVQDDLPLTSRPYADFSKRENISESEIVSRLRRLKESGVIRRYGAVVRHRKAGYSANAMVVWMVHKHKLDEAASILNKSDSVSHLYERKTFPGWDYNLYSMIHAKSDEDLVVTLSSFVQQLDSMISEYMILRSIREFKKTSMKYFIEENDL